MYIVSIDSFAGHREERKKREIDKNGCWTELDWPEIQLDSAGLMKSRKGNCWGVPVLEANYL